MVWEELRVSMLRWSPFLIAAFSITVGGSYASATTAEEAQNNASLEQTESVVVSNAAVDHFNVDALRPVAVTRQTSKIRLNPAAASFPLGIRATTLSRNDAPTKPVRAADLRPAKAIDQASLKIAQDIQELESDEIQLTPNPIPTEDPTPDIPTTIEAPTTPDASATPGTTPIPEAGTAPLPDQPELIPLPAPGTLKPTPLEGATVETETVETETTIDETVETETVDGRQTTIDETVETETTIDETVETETVDGQPTETETTETETETTEAETAEPRVLVAEVVVQGANEPIDPTLEDEVYRAASTRPGQTTTRTQLQEDINAIFATGYFANVQATPEDTPLGVRVTFVVEPNPVLQAVEVEGNTVLSDSVIDEIFEDEYGKTLNLQQLQEGIQVLTKRYQDEGFVLAQVVNVPQISPEGIVTLTLAEGTVESIQVRYINKEGNAQDAEGNPIRGRTRDFIVTREMQTKPGEVFNRNIAEQDLQRVFGLGIFEDVKLDLEPGEDPREVNVIVNIAERRASNIAAGAGISSASGLFGTVSYQQQNLGGNNQTIGAEIQVGERQLLFDLNFRDPWIAGDPFRTSYDINLFRRRNISLIFDGGDNDVRTVTEDGQNRSRPRVVRTGGGITFTRPFAQDVFSRPNWTTSLGFRYQAIQIQDDDGNLIKPDDPQTDRFGNVVGFGSQLSWSGTSREDLITVQFGAVRDRRNNPLNPTRGSLFRIGTEQSIPIGGGSIFFNRLRANYSFYLPTRLLKFDPNCRDVDERLVEAARPQIDPNACPQTFAFNLQGGTVIGDLPPMKHSHWVALTQSVRMKPATSVVLETSCKQRSNIAFRSSQLSRGPCLWMEQRTSVVAAASKVIRLASATSPVVAMAMVPECASSHPLVRFASTMH